MSAPAVAVPGEARPSVSDVLACRGGPDGVRRFLTEEAPVQLRRLLAGALGPGQSAADVACRLVRTKVKPGRRITATFEVSAPDDPMAPRPVVIRWSASDPPAPRDAATSALQVEAEQRGLAGPYRSLTAADPAGRAALRVAPFDPAFPQLVRLYDPVHVARLLPGSAHLPSPVTVTPVRYRPGQRHVVRVGVAGENRGVYIKAYRDDTGRAATIRAASLQPVLPDGDGRGRVVPPLGYVASERLALWPEVLGQPLGRVVVADADLARAAGALLRVLHEAPAALAPGDATGASSESAVTRRATEHVGALSPVSGRDVHHLLDRAVVRLGALSTEPPRHIHGDFKCDNLLVATDGLCVLDLDRSRRDDPAVDLGKFASDLRWYAARSGAADEDLVAAFLHGYGPCSPDRLRRATCYDVIYQLRAVGRRVPVHEEGWADRVAVLVERAADVLQRAGA